MNTYSEGDVQVNSTTIHYYRTGIKNKPSILLLHGVTDNGLCWPRVAHALQRDYDVIMPDARGHGQSTTTANFSLEEMADDIAGLIQALNVDQPYVWGHSMGALMAATLAASHPDLVRSVVLEDPPLMDNASTMQDEGQPATHGWEWLFELRALSRDERIARGHAQNPTWAKEEIPYWADSKAQMNVDILGPALKTAIDARWREIFSHIECPVLLLTADPDLGAIITPELVREVVRVTRNIEIVDIRGAGHNIHREQFEETMATVHEFLNRK